MVALEREQQRGVRPSVEKRISDRGQRERRRVLSPALRIVTRTLRDDRQDARDDDTDEQDNSDEP